MDIIKKEIEFEGKTLTLETGELAQQATLAVKATYGETVILATVVSGGLNTDLDFFPLKLEYEEKLYASGSIKSSRFVKREGRPTDEAIVLRRLIDHAIRPLFPKDFMDEVQIVLTIMSLDPEADAEVLAMLATSAVLHASTVPWKGPMTSARVGIVNGEYVLNPTKEVLEKESELDMMVSFAGKEQRFLAIEAEAHNLPEEKVLGGIEFARDKVKPLVEFLNDFAETVNPGIKKYEYESQEFAEDFVKQVQDLVGEQIMTYLDIDQKLTKLQRRIVRKDMLAQLEEKFKEDYTPAQLVKALDQVQKKKMRDLILNEGKRPQGRDLTTVRPISAKVGVLPRTHGTGLFNRGETQVLTVATLGSPSQELLIQDMYGERSKKYIHYYNFPPYSTGEVGRFGSPGGREIGHGMLAERALRPVVPSQEEFPYMIILMSEVMASNGSTSMASACGSTLALMDAGVPIKAMVAGISVGLISDDDFKKHLLLTDIQDIEDFAGNMDFKIAGTETGVTAIQLDMKVTGIPMDLLPKIFEQSKTARIGILAEMKKAIDTPRSEISKYAPKMLNLKIDPDKIGMVIGSGGKNIKDIQAKTGAEVGIDEEGNVFISAENESQAQKAYDIVYGMTKDVKVGDVYEGIVEELVDFGAFVEILPGRTGLLHVSEVAYDYVRDVNDFLKVGDTVKVKVIDTSPDGKVSLSKKALEEKPEGYEEPQRDFNRNSRGRNDRGGRGGRNSRDNRSRRR